MSAKFFSLIFLFLVASHAYPQFHATASGKFLPYKSHSPIKIDGILNEPIWQKALFADRLYDKEDSINYHSGTQVYFTYDPDNLYAAFACKVKDTSLLPTSQLYKDDEGIKANEWVAICVDTYNDGLSAYSFFVDAAGNQLDGALTPGNELTYSFSADWGSAIKRNATGYTVEIRIPLGKLPIRWNKENVEMTIRLVRFDKQNNREVQIPFLNTAIRNRIIQFQKIELKGIHQTHPGNLAGVEMKDRLAYKKSRIQLNTLEGRSHGGDASVMDYAIFKKRDIKGSEQPRAFHYSLQNDAVSKAFENTDYLKGYVKTYGFDTLLQRTQTSAFIVLQNDTIIYEKYFNGFNRNSIFTSFSIAKSFVSTLIGIAIADSYIKSDTDKITTYIPELLKKDSRFADIKIKDLLSMSSGMAYSEGGSPSDDDFTYQSPDLRKASLEHSRIEEATGIHWRYNNYNPLLLGLIIERTTHKTVAKYLEEQLWKKMGGDNASWSVDENGYEKMESGINCSAYDYARFAELLLSNGRYKNIQIVPEEWIQKATQPQSKPAGFYDALLRHNIYYSYFWWGKFRGSSAKDNDFFGLGNKGEYLYICPQKKLIIIRLGFEYGLPTPGSTSWPDLFYQFATNFKS